MLILTVLVVSVWTVDRLRAAATPAALSGDDSAFLIFTEIYSDLYYETCAVK